MLFVSPPSLSPSLSPSSSVLLSHQELSARSRRTEMVLLSPHVRAVYGSAHSGRRSTSASHELGAAVHYRSAPYLLLHSSISTSPSLGLRRPNVRGRWLIGIRPSFGVEADAVVESDPVCKLAVCVRH
ncbi:hypothetical protein B0H16DRAFT_1736081 [Mycena metata]|uniref:Uncharacterized protein n=1 Tax=Mycena metata TaxID=1033252 RepID=A0AAD7MP13_9AGAR|nr:hypothetical protein B0H16DRAFT_1736081 [Mycena metata]